jgi:hypothetical protein
MRQGGGQVARGATRQHEVGEGPSPTSGRWAAGTSPAAARSRGRAVDFNTREGGGRCRVAPALQCRAVQQRASH